MRRLLAAPAVWHGLSLLAAGAFIVVLQQGQWFFFDEFAFLQPGGAGLWEAHVGHWSTSPTLIYDAYVALFGLDSYLPFALTITVLHLAAVHLVWRIACRAGVDPWIATASVAVFAVFGSGGENILWAFQIGFVGALVVGLGAFLLGWGERGGSRLRLAATVVVSVFSLTWSGTAVPLVVATAAVVWWTQGWRRALLVAAIPAAVYLGWYLAVDAGAGAGSSSLGSLPVTAAQFIGVLFLLGVAQIFPGYVVGVAVLAAFVVWLVPTVRRSDLRRAAAVPLLLLGAAAVFILMAAVSRSGASVGSGRSGRYVYLVVLLALPALAYALSRLSRRFARARAIAVVVLVAFAGYQGVLLAVEASRQSAIEQQTHRLFSAALSLYVSHEPGLDPGGSPDPRWAPDLTMGELEQLFDAGRISIGPFDETDLQLVRPNVVRGG